MKSRSLKEQGCAIRYSEKFSGDHTGGDTPVPIPNTVVKPSRAYGTALATAWESRSSPGIKTDNGLADREPVVIWIGKPGEI